MKKTGIVIAAILSLVLNACNSKMTEVNPLLEASNNPFGAPAFDKIKNEHYKPAFEAAIAQGKAQIDSIVNNTEAPTFANTVEALEYSGRTLTNISSIFFNLNEAATDSVMQSIALEVSPMLTDYSNDIMLNEKLFARIKSVYDSKDSLKLNPEQARLLEETYKGFVRNGSNLAGEDKAKFKEINKELSQLGLQFGQNVLAATNKFFLTITDSSQLKGLPDYVKEMGAAEAKEKSVKGWVFTLQAPSYGPFMQYSENRELKEKMWKASNTKAFKDEFDNREIVKKIAGLRIERANLLGFATHADYVLDENMAKNPKTVNAFLKDLLDRTLPYAKQDVAEVEKYAQSTGFEGKLMPWDFSYYSEKYKNEKFAVNDELLKPYFKLENVQTAIFALADSLYGLKFKENKDIPVYHPDVKAYEVYDASGRFMSLLYMDFFPRASKRGGAWMTSFRDMSVEKGVEKRPFVSLVCNFTKPTETSPSLLTHYELTTLLHEFGHALHGMLAEGTYPSITGTNVARDFVELPSQIMENWAFKKEFLSSFAKHYQTGEAIPDELINKIIAAKNYLSGYTNIRQLSFGINDMAWHSLTKVPSTSVEAFEKDAIKATQLLPAVDSTCFTTSFSHIFAGGYSAGYYSYKWAEVLEADAFSLFEEKGIFSKEVAASFRDNILSKGNLMDADVLYRNFRGRDPKPEALLVKLGMGKK
ncbi:MAG TPA: M3 family metallopeptidase [Bacteroidales bacterium]|nr:M3 family metallopeptidase [Bacteroidales bacterium]